MATFVHLTLEAGAARIRKNGLARSRKPAGDRPSGVFAMPVTPSFFVCHQWLRELRRSGGGPIVGVYFRLRDDESVWVGHYGGQPREMTAAEAVAEFLAAESREGWEVLVPRRVEAGEILRIKSLPQVVGWRYFPGAHGQAPCPCRFCTAGTYGARRIRERAGETG